MEGDGTLCDTLEYAQKFQSTPSAWRETVTLVAFCETPLISIHSLRMEGDCEVTDNSDRAFSFQSTPSAWRETNSAVMLVSFDFNFNPLPPHGGRPNDVLTFAPFSYFNPLPPHGGRLPNSESIVGICHFNPLPPHGGRRISCFDMSFILIFQSTPSAWRETLCYS